MLFGFLLSAQSIVYSTEYYRNFTGHSQAVNSVCMSDAGILFSAAADNSIIQWTSGALVQRKYTGHSSSVTAIVASGSYLWSGSQDQSVRQWDVSTGASVKNFTIGSAVNSVALASGFLYIGSADGSVRRLDTNSGTNMTLFTLPSVSILSITVTGTTLFATTSSASGYAYQWDLSNNVFVRQYSGHTGDVTSACVSSDYLFSGSLDQTIKQWSLASGALIATFSGHNAGVTSVQYQSGILYSASQDNSIKTWNVAAGTVAKTLTGHANFVNSIIVTSSFIYSGSADRNVFQWFNFPCANGTGLASDYASCTTCAAGTYKSNSLFTKCLACPPNAICTPGSYTCDSGSLYNTNTMNCDKCAPGTFKTISSADNVTAICSPCAAGFECPAGGCSTCSACASGKYAPYAGTPACLTCPAGGECTALSFQCKAGYVLGNPATSCTACPVGSFKALPGNTTTCLPCTNGTQCIGSGCSTCDACPSSSYKPFVGYQPCAPCPLGAVCSTNDFICSNGYVKTFNTTIADSMSLNYTTFGTCTACPSGFTKPAAGNDGKCVACPSGSTCTASGYSCLPQYENIRGQFGCSPCVDGMVKNDPGNFECQIPSGTKSQAFSMSIYVGLAVLVVAAIL